MVWGIHRHAALEDLTHLDHLLTPQNLSHLSDSSVSALEGHLASAAFVACEADDVFGNRWYGFWEELFEVGKTIIAY